MDEDGRVMDFDDVVVRDRALLEKKVAAIRRAGPEKLQVIADFDETLTRYKVDGILGQSSRGLLRTGNPEYDAKRRQLWEKTHSLLVEGGLTYDDIRKSVSDARIAFWEGVIELFELLEKKGIPLVIFSAGLADIIEEVMRQKLHKSFTNIRIMSNRMVFDDGGHLLCFKGRIIHSLNKNEHALDMAAVVHDKLGDSDGLINDVASVKMRTNVLLLGDHIGDLGMSDGLKYDTKISVGFLNDNIEDWMDCHSKSSDVIYVNDAPMSGVVDLVSQLFLQIKTECSIKKT